jgi:hypothetical protein
MTSRKASHEALWALEGDIARDFWESGFWSPFSSTRTAACRTDARIGYYGFDFRVESVNGTKRMVINEEAP